MPSSDFSRDTNVSAWKSLAFVALGLALGVATAIVFQILYVDPQLGLGENQRVVEFGRLLGRPLPPETIVVLGNSIVLEGLAAEAAPEPDEPKILNCALSGFGLTEYLVVLPRLIAARPAEVVVTIEPRSFIAFQGIPLDRCYGYAIGEFPANWPKDWSIATFNGLKPKYYDAIVSSRWAQLRHFRNRPLKYLDGILRRIVQPKLVQKPADDWATPNEMEYTFAPPKFNKHLEEIAEYYALGMQQDDAATFRDFRRINDMLRDSRTPFTVVMLPVHPVLRERYATEIAELNTRIERIVLENGGSYHSAQDLLAAEDFADALHPNRSGREIFSRALERWTITGPTR